MPHSVQLHYPQGGTVHRGQEHLNSEMPPSDESWIIIVLKKCPFRFPSPSPR